MQPFALLSSFDWAAQREPTEQDEHATTRRQVFEIVAPAADVARASFFAFLFYPSSTSYSPPRRICDVVTSFTPVSLLYPLSYPASPTCSIITLNWHYTNHNLFLYLFFFTKNSTAGLGTRRLYFCSNYFHFYNISSWKNKKIFNCHMLFYGNMYEKKTFHTFLIVNNNYELRIKN